MSKKEKQPEEVIPEEQTAQAAAPEAAEDAPDPLLEELEALKKDLTDQEDKFLHLFEEMQAVGQFLQAGGICLPTRKRQCMAAARSSP